MTASPQQVRPAHLGWRLLALTYDLFPAFALVVAFGAIVTALAAVAGQPDLSATPWAGPLLATGVWAFAGAYFVLSWARGGQTLGMRPWRLRVVGANGHAAAPGALFQRYAWATLPAFVGLELAALVAWPAPGTPFWIAAGLALGGWFWAFIDREGLPLHDRLSGTRLVRVLSAA